MTISPKIDGVLDPDSREMLARVADVIIPRAEGMPAASDVEVASKLIDLVLGYSPELAPRLRELLVGFRDRQPEDVLRLLYDEDKKALELLVLACCGSYYMHPDVQALIGYTGQEAEVIDRAELPEYFEDGSLERTVAPPNIAREFAVLEEAA